MQESSVPGSLYVDCGVQAPLFPFGGHKARERHIVVSQNIGDCLAAADNLYIHPCASENLTYGLAF